MQISDAVKAPGRRLALVAELPRLLAPRPGRLHFALRVALICALTTVVAEIYQTPGVALTTYIVFFLNKPDRVESLSLDVVLTILVTLVIGLIFLMAKLVIDVPLWRVTMMTAVSIAFLFVAFASKLRPLGGDIMLIIAYALDLLGTSPVNVVPTRALLYAWLLVGVPAGVSAVVNLLIAPPPRRLAERAIAERLRCAAAALVAPNARVRQALTEYLREGVGEVQTWLTLAGKEKTSPPRDIAALGQAAVTTAVILSWVDGVSREGVHLIPLPLREQLANTLEEMARILVTGRYPIEITLERSGAEAALPTSSAGLWAGMRDLLAQYAQPPSPDSPPAGSAPHKKGGFFLPDAFTNPEYGQYALKTTAAAMFCYVLYSLLNWPAIHTCFITCYIVSLGTAAETIQKSWLRILGCFIGAAAGIAAIVYIMPHLTSIGGLAALVFVGALASAWVAAGSERISYVGFQIAFAFFLSVIQGNAPAFDLTVARDRTIGILLGNLVVYLLFTRLWPVSVTSRIDPALAAVLRRLCAMTTAESPAARRAIAAQVQGALGTIDQDLELAAYEPGTTRGPRWLDARRRAAHAIGALQGPLLLNTLQEPVSASNVGHRLNDVAEWLTSPAARAPPVTAAPMNRGGLDDMIDKQYRALVDALRFEWSPALGISKARSVCDVTV
ncbi:MAG TPA: FUSC family protein [Gemmatimonadaceae bacterium]|nr:FUSC family protein [Gemmatimonadaceae bacterium]